VHAAFGERIAVLTGDTLIIAAFHQLGYHRARSIPSDALAKVLTIIASGTGAPAGICAGQAWECEPAVNLAQYHQAKTGALFVASTCAGAAAADVDPQPWRALGAAIGQAYQVADDIQDCLGSADTLGKPAGRDATLGRPNAVHSLGVDGAVALLNRLLNDGIGSIPDCQGKGFLQALVEKQAERFFPPGYHREAA
jgi:geranylgeranyl diphosphate synthase type II